MSLRIVFGGVGIAVAIVIVQCSNAPVTTHTFPIQHRAVSASCPTTRPPGITSSDGGSPIGSSCTTDADCTQGTNGRCGPQGGNISGDSCTYDLCFTDTDCSTGNACLCNARGNNCLPENCRTDSDCAGLGCSPTSSPTCGPAYGTTGFYCHTANDECVDDADCNEGGLNGYCAYQMQVGHWACSYGFCT